MTNDKPLRVGLIGPGTIADQRLIPGLCRLPGVVFWSVLSRDLGKAQAFAERHKASAPQAAFTDLKQFLSDPDLDAVIIAVIDPLHAEMAIACCKAGKHVFIEKPMATTVDDAKRVVAAAEEAKVKVAVGYHLRFHAGHKEVARMIEEQALGRLLHMHVSWSYQSSPDDWRNASGTGRWWSLAAVGTHCLDLISWLMVPSCGPIVDVQSTLNSDVHGGPHDESAVVMLRFASGATACVVAQMNYTSIRAVEIVGSKGAVLCLDTLGPRGSGTISHNRQNVPFVVCDPYQAELADFVAAIRGGNSPLVNAGDGLANVNLLELAQSGSSKHKELS